MRLFSQRWCWKQRNLAKNQAKPLSLSQSQEKTWFWVKSREQQGDSLQTGRKPFSRAITMETTQLYGKQTVVWVQRVLANKKQKRCFLRYKAQRTQFWCQLTKTYFRYYEAWGSVFSGEKLNRCFFWHKVRSFQFRCQQTKTCFPYDKGSKAKFNSEKKGKACSQKHNAENSLP